MHTWALLPWLGWATVLSAATAFASWFVCRYLRTLQAQWLLAWPALWVLIEWSAAQGDMGMPWLRLGQQQAPNGPFASLLPIGGTLLAGLAMWFVAATILLAIRHRAQRNRWLVVTAAVVVVGLASRVPQWTEAGDMLNTALLQPGDKSLAQSDAAAAQELLTYYHDAALASSARLVVTPQLAIPKTIQAVPDAYWNSMRQALSQRQADILMGAYVGEDDALFNAAMSFGASGPQHYLKHQLFPFGESLPVSGRLREWLDQAMDKPMRDTARGPVPGGSMLLAGHRAAVFICFEAAFSEQWRAQAAAANVLSNMSSDSALASGQLSRQFRQVVQARALEFAKPVLRTSDVDGTFVVNHDGQIRDALAPQTRGVLEATVSLRKGLTPYARVGDALALSLCCIALLAAAILGRQAPARTGLPRLRTQAGQIMLPAVALLMMSAGMFYLLVNSSQAVNEKTRVTNAADAAAYSAGVVEARALNYHAYLNRAMVANQIVIAQMVSFGSWVRYFGNAVDNIGASVGDQAFMLAPNPDGLRVAATFAGTAYGLAYAGMTGNELADYVVQSVYGIGLGISIHDAVVQVTSAAQPAVQLNLAAGLRQQQIANDIVRAMDAGLSAQVVPLSHGFDTFTKRYSRNDSGGDGRGRFADVTTRSRDPFTRERNWTINSFNIPFIRRDPAMKKRGGTELVGFDEWRAVDTLELHGRRFGCGRFGLSWCDDIQTPIGWGAVNVNAGGGDAGAGYHGNAYAENGRTAGRADSAMEEPAVYSYHGIPASQELANLDPAAGRTTSVTVMVTKRHADTLTSGGAALAKPSGQLALFGARPAGASMVALSRAQVFFDRTDARADRREEIGSLYNPYWRVRLVAPTFADRGFAAAQQGGLLLP